jgi:starch phosphorylase
MQVAKMPEFVGHILLVEGYDLRLARRLVAGVDVWLNNPIYPLEASGTSGMKASMNGAINLSILDGWWDEGYDGGNGWAIKPASDHVDQEKRNADEARTLYELLQDHVIPLYYARDGLAYSPGWVAMAKRAMASILPQFSGRRMLDEYVAKFYVPAAGAGARLASDGCAPARDLAAWKMRVQEAWPGVSLRRADAPPARIAFGEKVKVAVEVTLNGLATDDVAVELLLRQTHEVNQPWQQHRLAAAPLAAGTARYEIELAPDICGKLDYRLRAYPHHPLLTHRFEVGLMRWL